MIYFGGPMRVSPTLTFYNTNNTNANWRNLSLPADSGAASGAGLGDMAVAGLNPQVAGDAIGHVIAVHWTADADF